MADSHVHSFCQELRRLRSVVRSYDTLEKARLQGQTTDRSVAPGGVDGDRRRLERAGGICLE